MVFPFIPNGQPGNFDPDDRPGSMMFLKTIAMNNEIYVSRLDYVRLNSMILDQLEIGNPNLLELNRLNMEIKRARQVEPRKINPDCVTMNSVIEVLFLEQGTSSVIKLVYPKDAKLEETNISVLSPLGCALLGYKKGQTVSYHTPGGMQSATIYEILHQPEREGFDLG
jgi:regulator of nucleoside diphosphate kinase